MAPPRKPTALKLVTGSAQKHPERINKREPKLKRGIPEAPLGMTREGRKHFKRFADIADAHLVLTPWHGVPIAEIAETYAVILKLRKEVDRDGTVISEPNVNGDPKTKVHPGVPALLQAQRTMFVMLGHFGLTPSSVAHVAALEEPKNKSDFFGDDQ